MTAETRALKRELRILEAQARSLAKEIRFHTQHALEERVRCDALESAAPFWLEYYEAELADAKASFEKTQHAIANTKLKLTKQKRGWYWK